MSVLPESWSPNRGWPGVQTTGPRSPRRPAGAGPEETLLSSVVAAPGQRRVGVGVIILSVIAFAAAAPFAQVPLVPIPAFIPAYETALAIVDLITAVLLFGQLAQRHSVAVLALAAGYLFDGLMTIP